MRFIDWFYHNVWGNLVASGITTTVAYLRLRTLGRRHHEALIKHITETNK